MTRLLAYVVVGIIGVIIFNLARTGPKPVAQCYLWMLGTGWLTGLAMALFAWHGAR